jgi:hypothetical protein
MREQVVWVFPKQFTKRQIVLEAAREELSRDWRTQLAVASRRGDCASGAVRHNKVG